MAPSKTILTATALLLATVAPASGQTAKHLKSLEIRAHQLSAYYSHNCTGLTIARDCTVVVGHIQEVQRQIAQATQALQSSVQGRAFQRQIESSSTSALNSEYNEEVTRLIKLNEQIDALIQQGAPAGDSRLQRLQSQASRLHMRLLRLQSRLKGAD